MDRIPPQALHSPQPARLPEGQPLSQVRFPPFTRSPLRRVINISAQPILSQTSSFRRDAFILDRRRCKMRSESRCQGRLIHRCYVCIYFGSVSGGGAARPFLTPQALFAHLQVVRTDAERSPVQKHPANAADARIQKLQHRPPDFCAAF